MRGINGAYEDHPSPQSATALFLAVSGPLGTRTYCGTESFDHLGSSGRPFETGRTERSQMAVDSLLLAGSIGCVAAGRYLSN